MRFYTRPKSRPTIPIVPLIDILCILLIFFIVTTQFKKPQHSVVVDLPRSGGLPTATNPEERLVLAVSKTGELQLAAAPVKKEDLKAALASHKAARPGVKLELKADSAVSLQALLEVWSALHGAGIPLAEVPLRVQPGEAVSVPPPR